MAELILITGGARSGKSTFAEKLLADNDDVLYVATAHPFDGEMEARIQQHRSRRNKKWGLLEAYRQFDKVLPEALNSNSAVLLDCVTVIVSNLMLLDHDEEWDTVSSDRVRSIESYVMREFEKLLSVLETFSGTAVLVTNELGMGIVPVSPLGRHFRDIAGRVNQKLAAAAAQVYLVVSGIEIKIKGV